MKRQVKHPMDLVRLVLTKASKSRSKSSGGGFTLIESLVAIIIVSITVVAISPPIFWATGTRVQNRRAEQALSIAQATIDQVRARVERGGSTALELPAIDTGAAAGKRPNPAGPLPSAQWTPMQSVTPTCNTVSLLRPAVAAVPATETTAAVPAVSADQQYPAVGQYLPVMTTTDPTNPTNPVCKPDFLVQVFRNDGICDNGPCSASTLPANERRPLAFSVGVRVYSALATKGTVLEKEKASLKGTTGTGQAGIRPLAVLYATVAKSDASASLNNYRALCNKASDKSCE